MQPRALPSGERGLLTVCKWLVLLVTLATLQAQSQPAHYRVGSIQVSELRAPPTPPNAAVAAVYMSIHNGGHGADSLLTVSTPMAIKAEIHRSTMTQGVMQMRAVSAVDIPPDSTIKIEPGALHIMLQGLKRPLTQGSAFPLTLEFRNAGMLLVQVPVAAVE